MLQFLQDCWSTKKEIIQGVGEKLRRGGFEADPNKIFDVVPSTVTGDVRRYGDVAKRRRGSMLEVNKG